MVVAEGDTTALEPLTGPGSQVKVAAPLAESVAELPAQIEGEEAEGVMVGVGLTSNETVLLVRHPNALAPVTVYTCVAAGETTVETEATAPGFHV